MADTVKAILARLDQRTIDMANDLETIKNQVCKINGQVRENQLIVATHREQLSTLYSKCHDLKLDVAQEESERESCMAEVRASFVSMRKEEIKPLQDSVHNIDKRSSLWGALSGGGLVAVVEFLKAYLIH